MGADYPVVLHRRPTVNHPERENQKDLSMVTEWKSIDYIKTQEDLDNYVEAYIESFKNDLNVALGALKEIAVQVPQSGQARLMRKAARDAYVKIVGKLEND